MGKNGNVDSNKVPTNSAMTYKVGPSFTSHRSRQVGEISRTFENG